MALHRTRNLLVKQRTQLVNMVRGLLAEFGIDIPRGLERAVTMARQITEGEIRDVPDEAATAIAILCEQVLDAHERLRAIDRAMLASQRANDIATRLATLPGIGPVARRHSRRRSPIRTSLNLAASLQRGSGSRRCRSRVAATSGRDGSARWAINICASC